MRRAGVPHAPGRVRTGVGRFAGGVEPMVEEGVSHNSAGDVWAAGEEEEGEAGGDLPAAASPDRGDETSGAGVRRGLPQFHRIPGLGVRNRVAFV
jgi:hypothetical protein